ncbi:imelysin family protein [Catenovulum sp. SM1970]|uniref:imelysin family protein n=1 Tax=Marinifaba aquimaris TaxID=2741323 RepID=UPI0015734F52|nr:imelysin family protein [Marinifaba aquimaris]NTS76998.1 imelysin family protein [Marinifaba aquimaris]
MQFKFKPCLIATLISTALLAGCGESTSSSKGPNFGGGDDGNNPPPPTNFDEKALIENLVDNVITPVQNQLTSQSAVLVSQVESLCTAYSDGIENTAQLDLVQAEWRNTMALWQQIEAMQLEPLTVNDSQLRNLVYSWPNQVSSCGVDQDVIHHENGNISGTPYDISRRSVTRRGLDANEYLLFSTNLDHTCSSNSGIVEGWNQRPDAERRLARCEYAITVTQDLQANIATYIDAWDGADGYALKIKNADVADNGFESLHDAVNVISDSLFYLDKELKDTKLGAPLGIFANSCGGATCPVDVESPYSHNSLLNIENNLVAFKALFSGEGIDAENTLGFDDFLIHEQDQQTADIMLDGVNNALISVKAINGTLAGAVINDNDQVQQTYDDVKQVSDQLKTNFIESLALELPKTSAGDND